MPSVLVTGATRGIGLGIASRLADLGYQVIGVARHAGRQFEEAADAVNRNDLGSLHFLAADLSDIASLPTFVRATRKEFGSIYGLVNNAGSGRSCLLATMSDREIAQTIQLNVISPIVLTKYVTRQMLADGYGGRVVNVSSIVGFSGFKGLAAYSAAKAALLGFARPLSRELGAANITVNSVAPGFVDTELTASMDDRARNRMVRRSALKRTAEIADVAEAVAFFLGDAARNVTGTVLTIDAGATA